MRGQVSLGFGAQPAFDGLRDGGMARIADMATTARGLIRTGDPAGATTWAFTSSAVVQSAVLTTPQLAQVLDSSWYSVITGAGTGARSTTCRRSDTVAAAPVNDPRQPQQCAGSIGTNRSGLSDNDRDTPGSPGCLHGLRPDRSRQERCFAGFLFHGGSEDGGREEFDESAPSRRSSSATRAVNLSINSACAATNSRSSASVESVTNQLSRNTFP